MSSVKKNSATKPAITIRRESLENQLRFYSTDNQNCCKVPYLAKLFKRLWKEDSYIIFNTNQSSLKKKMEDSWKTTNL